MKKKLILPAFDGCKTFFPCNWLSTSTARYIYQLIAAHNTQYTIRYRQQKHRKNLFWKNGKNIFRNKTRSTMPQGYDEKRRFSSDGRAVDL